MNRLINEKSPYLLQHAANPVDWYPWGEEAFARAEKENKPILLSIGYSTCHWCHVMARESFEDPKVARLLNDAFVCIKVDREERPDIDSIYMRVCTMLNNSGGWPLTIIMTPEKKPFFAGTYFPKKTRLGRIGMLELSVRIKQIWNTRQQEVIESAAGIVKALQEAESGTGRDGLQMEIIGRACNRLTERFDQQHGGFGSAPKFPSPHSLLFLLRYWKHSGEARALYMADKTLSAMRQGGIFDHIGFGFHRYSTDQQWLLPHFEKMLYDQAMLAMAYTEGYQATAKPLYKRTVEEIFAYVERVMTHDEGGFYSAEDADSEGVEGKFYLWTVEELRRLLPPDEARLALAIYNVSPEGNFSDEASGRRTGTNILHLRSGFSELADELEMDVNTLQMRLENIRQRLFVAREQRIHPHKDDKILTDWNGLMIAALARGARVFGSGSFLAAASRAADFILKKIRTSKGLLLHRFREGEAGVAGMLDDYAFLVWGLIELYEAGFNNRYLREALSLTDIMLARFQDRMNGGFFQTEAGSEELFVRRKEHYDGAIPSGNSVALSNLLRLSRLLGRTELEEAALLLVEAFGAAIEENLEAHTHFLAGLQHLLNRGREIVIVGDPQAADTREMIRALQRIYEPNNTLLFKNSADQQDDLPSLATFTESQTAIEGHATAYICNDLRCRLPTTDLNEAIRRSEKR